MTAGLYEFEATAYALRAPVFGGRNDAHIFDETFGIAWEQILDRPWSAGEQVLVDLALELWTGRHDADGATFRDLSLLDDTNFDVAITAIQIRRGRMERVA